MNQNTELQTEVFNRIDRAFEALAAGVPNAYEILISETVAIGVVNCSLGALGFLVGSILLIVAGWGYKKGWGESIITASSMFGFVIATFSFVVIATNTDRIVAPNIFLIRQFT